MLFQIHLAFITTQSHSLIPSCLNPCISQWVGQRAVPFQSCAALCHQHLVQVARAARAVPFLLWKCQCLFDKQMMFYPSTLYSENLVTKACSGAVLQAAPPQGCTPAVLLEKHSQKCTVPHGNRTVMLWDVFVQTEQRS